MDVQLYLECFLSNKSHIHISNRSTLRTGQSSQIRRLVDQSPMIQSTGDRSIKRGIIKTLSVWIHEKLGRSESIDHSLKQPKSIDRSLS